MGFSSKAKVICRKGRRNPRVTHDGNREMVTVIEAVCASGYSLNPLLFIKEHNIIWDGMWK